jgi:hypothetical protein
MKKFIAAVLVALACCVAFQGCNPLAPGQVKKAVLGPKR